MGIQVVAHTSYLGHTGYNNHSRNFFTNLDKYIPVRVRNYSYVDDLSYLKPEEKRLLIQQDWNDPPHKIGRPFQPNPKDTIVNLILNETNHYFFYDKYEHPMIAYNVWEATRQPSDYFNRVLEYDQFWCPTEWQRQCTIEQGYPAHRVKVVPEGIDGNIFCPTSKVTSIRNRLYKKYNIPKDKFSFMLFGRWDYRKSTTEVIQAFLEEFKNDNNVVLIASVDNPFSVDGLKTTEERLKHNKLESDKIKILHFPERREYVEWIQSGHVFLCCPRSEGWNLPLIEAIASGTPSICSGWGAHLEFADGIAYKVNVPIEKSPNHVFNIKPGQDLGVWGEPDFDHLKKVMRTVYNEYSEAKQFAVKASKNVREKFSWDNAAKTAETHIKDLIKNFKVAKPSNIEKKFETNFQLENGNPKVTFKPLIDIDGKILVRMKDTSGNVRYESWFDDVKVNLWYWIVCNIPLHGVNFEIVDELQQIIHSEFYENIETPDVPLCEDMELYQDQYVNGSVIMKGKRDCNSRYEAMKQVFDKYKRPFTILDIGANFGYYSIRAATEYDTISVMIEGKDGETETLVNLCHQNECRDKLIVLKSHMNLQKLKELTKCEHFDVVLALNVIHHFENDDILEVCKTFTELGDNLILETPPVDDIGACGQNNLKIITDYFDSIGRTSLGKFERHTSDTKSNMFWFKTPKTELKWPYYNYENLFNNPNIDAAGVKVLKERGSNRVYSDYDSKYITTTRKEEKRLWIAGMNLRTFLELNGIYPHPYQIIEKLTSRNIQGDYAWNNTNNDLVVHNIILRGHNLHMIDFDDKFIQKNNLTDDHQVKIITNDISKYYEEIFGEDEVKLNLGCGNDIKEGYINIDKYDNTGNVDMKCDIGDLPFEDGSVDEIYTSHVFEHIGLTEIYSVLTEWRRVLRKDGRLVMRLPDLETEVKIWLDADDDKKWGEVHRIFGAQSHPGNTHFCGFNPGSLKSFLESFDFQVEKIGLENRGFGTELQTTAIKKETPLREKATYTSHFVNGPFIEVKGNPNDKGYYITDFLDPDNNSTVHQHLLKINQWTRPHRTYFTNWLIQVRRNGVLEHEHKFDLKGKNVLIGFDTKSLGDTLAWFPYVEEFRKQHECHVWISTFWNKLFKGHKKYSHLEIIEPGTVVENLYASYSVGCYDDNYNKNKNNWKSASLQEVCTDMLGVEYKEIIPEIAIPIGFRPVLEKYVTLAEFSTFQCKFWNYPGGWQQIVDYLNDCGYKVMVISKEKTNLKNIIDNTDKPIEETINNIAHSEFLLGVSAGPAWLAWALRKPVVLISGFSLPVSEFNEKCVRVINTSVCHGCFNDINLNFDRGDWNWCPRQKGTYRQFECTKKITPEFVKKSIEIIEEAYLTK